MTKSGSRKTADGEYLTTQEVAERLRVTRRTVYNWITGGRLAADKAGPKLWRVTPAQLDAFQAQDRAPYLSATQPRSRPPVVARPGSSPPSPPSPRRARPEPLPGQQAAKPARGAVPSPQDRVAPDFWETSFGAQGGAGQGAAVGQAQNGGAAGGASSLPPAKIEAKKKPGGGRRR
jgi:excisionase family DNA binding protein